MFGPTFNLQELSRVIAASSVADSASGELAEFLIAGQGRDGFDTISGCEYAASLVFREISDRHGEDEGRRIFATLGVPRSKRKQKREPGSPKSLEAINNEALLQLVDIMRWDIVHSDGKKPRLSIDKIAEQLTELGLGPRGKTTQRALSHHINLQLRKRRRNTGGASSEFDTPHVARRLTDMLKAVVALQRRKR